MKLIKFVSVPFLFAISFAQAARADVIVYRLKQTGKIIGGGQEINLRGNGFVIVDPDSKQGYTLAGASYQNQKFFITTTFTNTRIYTVSGAKGKTYTLFASSSLETGRDRNQLSRGQNVPLAITSSRTVSFPKTIAGAGGSIFDFGGEPVLLDGKATATFSPTDTRTANDAAETVDQTYARVRQMLIDQGYEEFSL